MAKSNKESGSQQWFLRTGVNAEFGPIEKNGLQLWAEQARILPGHEVSSDRVNWVSATSIDFLDMNWFIDDGDGDLKGPLNHLAAETLIKNGKFSEGARIIAADQIDAPRSESEEKPLLEKKVVVVAPVVLEKKEKPKSAPVKLDSFEHDELDGERDAAKAMLSAMKLEQEQTKKKAQELELKVKQLEKLLRQSKNEQKQLEERYVSSDDHQSLVTENTALRRELNGVKKRSDDLQEAGREKEVQIERLKRDVADKNKKLAVSEQTIMDVVKARESALQQCRESERSFARLLSDANKRDIDYKTKIEALKKTSTLSPEATSRFYSDQNAVFQILKREADSITKKLEAEREHLNALKSMGARRQQELQNQRQILQNQIGNSPLEMTSRVLREQTVDPNAVRIRSELDNLKIAHERTCRRAEERERELNLKLKVMHSDCNKLMEQLLEKAEESLVNQKLQDQLADSEQALVEIRRNYEAERKQFMANNNTMIARIDELENGVKGAVPEVVQSSEARGVKLASWMSFKK
ncbi:MAG: hypothetical protein PF904_14360 [Kiritimatiellae bacterium]|jgi:hypothetical protein|nr:hypothetical protein [Kiritimatiellia bacterium]